MLSSLNTSVKLYSSKIHTSDRWIAPAIARLDITTSALDVIKCPSVRQTFVYSINRADYCC